MKRKILALLLVLALAVSLVPMALADDAPAAEAIRKFGQELNAAVMASLKEFSEKTGYAGPYPSTEINKAITQKLNEVISNQLKGLMELSKTAV